MNKTTCKSRGAPPGATLRDASTCRASSFLPNKFGDSGMSSRGRLILFQFALALAFFSAPPATGQSTGLDKYGGAKSLKCAHATGWFHTEKISNRWWLCTPLGNAFYALMMNGVTPNVDSTYTAAIARKYGSTMAWTIEANTRLLSWNFNTLTSNAYLYNLPFGSDNSFPLDSNGIHSQPVKMPFTSEVRPAYYAMKNPAVGAAPFLTNPVKNMIYVHSPYYTGYVASGGVADYYDSGVGTWLHNDLTTAAAYGLRPFNRSPYQNYLIGIMLDDGDEMNGFGAGPDFATKPAGHNNFNLAMQVAAMSPVQTANPNLGFVYADTLVHSKKALRDQLVTKYVTVTALNSAWGSNYTTFDSTGSPITDEAVATGDGSTLTFSHKLEHPIASKFSVQVFVDGKPVAGETDKGDLWGPQVTG